jgi:hypothetical protein
VARTRPGSGPGCNGRAAGAARDGIEFFVVRSSGNRKITNRASPMGRRGGRSGSDQRVSFGGELSGRRLGVGGGNSARQSHPIMHGHRPTAFNLQRRRDLRCICCGGTEQTAHRPHTSNLAGRPRAGAEPPERQLPLRRARQGRRRRSAPAAALRGCGGRRPGRRPQHLSPPLPRYCGGPRGSGSGGGGFSFGHGGREREERCCWRGGTGCPASICGTGIGHGGLRRRG